MLLDLVYIYPGGVRTGLHLFFFGKSVFLKHPNGQAILLLMRCYIAVCICPFELCISLFVCLSACVSRDKLKSIYLAGFIS